MLENVCEFHVTALLFHSCDCMNPICTLSTRKSYYYSIFHILNKSILKGVEVYLRTSQEIINLFGFTVNSIQ